MTGDPRKTIGRLGEEAAARYLERKGMAIVERNWQTRLGELDLIARSGTCLVFVEVRTTSGRRFGYGFQSVDVRKQQKVRRLAMQYLQQKRLLEAPIRFDVVSVLLDARRQPIRIDHIEGAF